LAPQYHRETKNYKTADIEAPAAQGHTAERGGKKNYRYWVGESSQKQRTEREKVVDMRNRRVVGCKRDYSRVE